jgi:hypothetical protein
MDPTSSTIRTPNHQNVIDQLREDWRIFASNFVKLVREAHNSTTQRDNTETDTPHRLHKQSLLDSRADFLKTIHTIEATLQGKIQDLEAMQSAIECDARVLQDDPHAMSDKI